MKTNVAVFFGGQSVEHEVSIISAMQAIAALDTQRYQPIPIYMTKDGRLFSGPGFDEVSSYKDLPALLKKGYQVTLVRLDNTVLLVRYPVKRFSPLETPLHVALPVVHGTGGEDGTVAGLCESVGLPYAGCDIFSAALCMDKGASKAVMQQAGLPVLPCLLYNAPQFNQQPTEVLTKIEEAFPYPLIVKPNNLGSSVGISRANDRDALLEALELAFQFTNKVLIERCLVPLREINCAVLGDLDDVRASVCEHPFSSDEILSYQDKYLSGGKQKGMGSGGREIPANLPEEVSKRVKELSVAAFNACGCAGVVRVDCMIDDNSGDIYINELNTIPGSLAFYLWEASGLSFPDLLHELLTQALNRKRQRSALVTTIPTNILSNFSGAKGNKV